MTIVKNHIVNGKRKTIESVFFRSTNLIFRALRKLQGPYFVKGFCAIGKLLKKKRA